MGIIRTLAILLNVSYESSELHQSYTMLSPFLSFSLFVNTRGRKLTKDVGRMSLYLVTSFSSSSTLSSIPYVLFSEPLLPFFKKKKNSVVLSCTISSSFNNLKYSLRLKIHEHSSKVKLRCLMLHFTATSKHYIVHRNEFKNLSKVPAISNNRCYQIFSKSHYCRCMNHNREYLEKEYIKC